MVEITRSEETRNLRAVIVQERADGRVAGQNILRRCSVRRIETAKERVRSTFADRCGEILFEVKAAPDWTRAPKAGSC